MASISQKLVKIGAWIDQNWFDSVREEFSRNRLTKNQSKINPKNWFFQCRQYLIQIRTKIGSSKRNQKLTRNRFIKTTKNWSNPGQNSTKNWSNFHHKLPLLTSSKFEPKSIKIRPKIDREVFTNYWYKQHQNWNSKPNLTKLQL